MKSLVGSNIVRVKNHNRHAILMMLLREPLSRVELAQKLNISSMTVTNLVSELLAEGWLIEGDKTAVSHSNVGRPRQRLQIHSQAGYTIGVHIGIGIIRVGIVNLIGELAHLQTFTFDTIESATAVLAQIHTEIGTLIAQSTVDPAKILGIGVGASGLIDNEQGICVTAPSLNWHDVPIAEFLQSRTQLPTVVENNIRAMALAEAHFGQGRDVSSLAFIYGRIGVGAGFVMNGTLFRGTQAGAGEIGHTIIQPDSHTQCRCGQMGCLETLVTQPVIEQNLAELGMAISKEAGEFENGRFEQILVLARDGNTAVQQQIEATGHYLGIAITNLINTLNPERIILGGMYHQGAEFYLPQLRQIVKERAFGGLGQNVQITATCFGLEAGVIGAASLALMAQFYEQ